MLLIKQIIQEQKTRNSNLFHILQNARLCIEAITGIKLTLIELVELKEISRQVSRLYKSNNSLNKISPITETVDLFLYHYYEVPFSPGFNIYRERQEFIKRNGYDGFSDFWRERQEKAHFP